MPIKIDVTPQQKIIKVKALGGPNFKQDRDFLATLPSRTPRWGFDQELQKDCFNYWEISFADLKTILEKYPANQLLLTNNAQIAVDKIMSKLISIEDLEPEIVDWSVIKDASGERDLLDHQRKFISINKKKTTLLCSFAQGLGKTMTALLRSKMMDCKKVLIICPLKLKSNWRAEISLTMGEQSLIFWGSKRQKEKIKEKFQDAKYIIATYESVGGLVEDLNDVDCVIIDEIHNLANPSTTIYKSTRKVLRKYEGAIRLGLSGTPMRLKLKNLWAVLDLLEPGMYGSCSQFTDKYEEVLAYKKIKSKTGREVKIPIKVRSKNEDKLKAELKTIMVREKRDGIVNFGDIPNIVTTELSSKQRDLYDNALNNIRVELETGELELKNVLTRMLRLLQISEGLFNIEGCRHKDSAKLDYICSEIDEHVIERGEKIILWSRFLPITQEIYNRYPDHTVVYTGKQSENMRDLAVYAFQGVTSKEDEERFFELKSKYPEFKFNPGEAMIFDATHHLRSGLGINLHANCNRCIFSSFDPNPNAIMQAKDRIARIGQKEKEVYTTFLVSEDTIERTALITILKHYESMLRILDGVRDNDLALARKLVNILKV